MLHYASIMLFIPCYAKNYAGIIDASLTSGALIPFTFIVLKYYVSILVTSGIVGKVWVFKPDLTIFFFLPNDRGKKWSDYARPLSIFVVAVQHQKYM